MLPRVMPCLQLQDARLVKTCRFASPVYVGDPVNVISIFNEFEVDEIVLVDIRATVEHRPPPLEVLAAVADEAMVPLVYGGGVTTLEQFGRILWTGYEKVVVGTASVTDPALISQASARFGRQAVVVAIDATRDALGGHEVMTHSGTRRTGRRPVDHAQAVVDAGAGEILLTSIDQEGTMQGYDLDLVAAVSDAVPVPVIACGGAGSRADLAMPVKEARASAVAAGSLFVFSGPQRAVLVNFPSRRQLGKLFEGGPSPLDEKGS